MSAKDGGNAVDAERVKATANSLFQEHKFHAACDAYSQAIELNPNVAVYFANRAFTQLKLENYGSALADASKAIDLDKTYIKAYYRRGSAFMALGKYKDALRDFQAVVKIHPKDADAASKLKECKRVCDAERFAAAIRSEAKGRELPSARAAKELEAMEADGSYSGPRLPENGSVSREFVLELLPYFKAQKRLHKRYVVQMLLAAVKLFGALPTVVDASLPSTSEQFTVCGDTHGQFYDLCNIFDLNGLPSADNPYLFNGDMVDRGSFSIEIILLLLAFKLSDPSCMHITRGNHESRNMNKMYGFEGESRAKYPGELVFELFLEVFCLLPLAVVLEKKILVVHGGLFSKDGVMLDDIRKIDRNREPPDEGLMSEILWSDPQKAPGWGPSKRGVGVSFGPDVTKRFLAANNLDLVVRSHECKDEGYEVEADGKLITIFSAPNYCDQMGNKGAFIKFGKDLKPKFTQFTAVPHPDVRPMAYANNLLNFL